ncbi:MAG: hypothetical protein RIQ53_150 [Pseudomonadota bacterium]
MPVDPAAAPIGAPSSPPAAPPGPAGARRPSVALVAPPRALADLPPAQQALILPFEDWLAHAQQIRQLSRPGSLAVYQAMWWALSQWAAGQQPAPGVMQLDAVLLLRYLDSRQGMAGPDEPLTLRYRARLLGLVQRVQAHQAARLEQLSPPGVADLMRRDPALRESQRSAAQEPPDYLPHDDCLRLTQWLQACADEVHLPPAGRRSAAAPLPERWQSLRDATACALQLLAGLGPGAVRALRVTDVDCRAASLHPLRIQVPADGSMPAYEVPLDEPLATALLAHWLQRRAREGLGGDGLFPSTRSGKPWGKVAQFTAGRRVLTAAGIARQDGGSFRLRHTWALQRLRGGWPPEQLARRLGIIDPGVMARYRRLLDEAPAELPPPRPLPGPSAEGLPPASPEAPDLPGPPTAPDAPIGEAAAPGAG